MLYAKWLLLVIVFPFHVLRMKSQMNGSRVLHFLSKPYGAVEQMFRGGYVRFELYHLSTFPSIHFRIFCYRLLGAKIAPKVVMHFKTELRQPEFLVIGEGTIIGDNALLDARNGLRLGSNVNLSSNVSIYTEQHNHRDPYFRCNNDRKMGVEVGNRVWIGSNVVILPGVVIGEGAVCCAGCVVTKNVEPYAIVAGIPAKKVGERSRNLLYRFDGKISGVY